MTNGVSVPRFSYTFVPAPLLLLPSLAVSWFCFEKLHGHKQMLEQMASFDLKNAHLAKIHTFFFDDNLDNIPIAKGLLPIAILFIIKDG